MLFFSVCLFNIDWNSKDVAQIFPVFILLLRNKATPSRKGRLGQTWYYLAPIRTESESKRKSDFFNCTEYCPLQKLEKNSLCFLDLIVLPRWWVCLSNLFFLILCVNLNFRQKVQFLCLSHPAATWSYIQPDFQVLTSWTLKSGSSLTIASKPN